MERLILLTVMALIINAFSFEARSYSVDIKIPLFTVILPKIFKGKGGNNSKSGDADHYNYRNGICKNEKGESGYNVSHIGDCGDLSNSDFNSHIFTIESLKGANLSYADLGYASLYSVKLDGAIFRGANMHECVLARGNVSNADLSNANLSSASLVWAIFDRSIFFGANLKGADLRGATLDSIFIDEKTDFSEAVFDEYTWLPFSKEKALEKGMKFVLTDGE